MIGVFASQVRPQGQQVFTTVGANTFTVPQRVFAVSVVAVGGGGGGSTGSGSGGSGGAGGNLGYKNAYAVTPGASLAVQVGAGGIAGGAAGGAGGESAFATPALRVFGGLGSSTATGGAANGAAAIGATASFLGGTGGSSDTATAGGGGGAAGYAGNGGNGGIGTAAGSNGAGGAGGGGGAGGSSDAAGAGGGVGLFGLGADGSGGAAGGANGFAGTGGSGGVSGSASTGSTATPSTGGLYGGGGGGAELTGENGPGGQGAVRVIWGWGQNALRQYLATAINFFFYNTTAGWIAGNATLTAQASSLKIDPQTTDPIMTRPGLSIAGASNRYVHMTYRRTVAGTNPYLTGAGVGSDLFWSTSSRAGASESFKQSLPSYTWDGTSFITTTLDMHNPTFGGTEWATSTITELRVDFETSLVPYEVEAIEVSNSATPTYHLTKNV